MDYKIGDYKIIQMPISFENKTKYYRLEQYKNDNRFGKHWEHVFENNVIRRFATYSDAENYIKENNIEQWNRMHKQSTSIIEPAIEGYWECNGEYEPIK